ncbi:18528_t:CDS:10 [Dentiscutata erythropus]|uniref:18528_t:CDS:1 n=1 Tax=Dentiscutata erythropus TaxID=1348616 RepID=A0A9N9NKY0_9GLOM|nr:18528_t:CDS:10 [Dentiscutata erythropus]
MKLPPVGFFLNLREGQGQLDSVLRTTRSFAAQWESTKSFWCDVELEKIEKEKQLIEKKMEQAEMQFGLDQSLAGNEAQVILNETKLGILSDRKNSKRKAIHTGKDDTDALTSPTEKDEIDIFFQSHTNAITKRPKLDEKNILNEEGPISYSQKLLNEGIELETHKKAKTATRVASKTNTQKSKNASETSTQNNNEKFSEQSSSFDLGPEGDEEIKLDFASIEKELLREQSNEWEVDTINVSQRFKKYQIEILEKVKTDGLRWCDFHEVLALSSVIVLNSPCPYPGHIFTNREWRAITCENPYVITEPVLPSDVCFSLRNSLAEFMEGKAPFLSLEDSEIGRVVSRIFNDMCSSVPKVSPTKTSEDEHCFKLLHPIIRPLFFTDSCEEYVIRLNRATSGTATRPDFSCLVNDIPILNSEIKPPGFTPLQGQKDKLKVQLRARKSINQLLRTKGGPDETVLLTNQGDLVESHIMDLKYDGLYRSWPFLTTRLVKDKTTIPLMESNIRHMKALEERISKIAENYNSRGCQNETTPLQIRYMRDLPNSPQIKKILNS